MFSCDVGGREAALLSLGEICYDYRFLKSEFLCQSFLFHFLALFRNPLYSFTYLFLLFLHFMIFVCSFRENVVKNRTGVKIFNFFLIKIPLPLRFLKKDQFQLIKLTVKLSIAFFQHSIVSYSKLF